MLTGLYADLLVSFNRSWIHFCWKIKIQDFEQVTSILIKYLNLPCFLISNSFVRPYFSINFSFSLFHITIMLSTYSRRIITPSIFRCLMTRMWFPWVFLNPKPIITLANLSSHTPGNCLSSYKSSVYIPYLVLLLY